MDATITIYCKNTHTYHEVPRGISLIELKDLLHFQLPYPIIAAHVNYKVENLTFRLYKPKDIEFLDASSPSGMRAPSMSYTRVWTCVWSILSAKDITARFNGIRTKMWRWGKRKLRRR